MVASRSMGLPKPTVPDVLPLVRDVYQRNALGCCLHILTDDGNMEESHGQFCLGQARKAGHADCIAAAEALVQMSKTQRKKIYRTRRLAQ